MMAPIRPMASTPRYIELAGLSSDPMMPTARFIQTRRNAATSATPTAARYAGRHLPAFLTSSSNARPVPNRSVPAKTKSNRLQATSSVNCMASKGTSNINATTCDKKNVFVLHKDIRTSRFHRDTPIFSMLSNKTFARFADYIPAHHYFSTS